MPHWTVFASVLAILYFVAISGPALAAEHSTPRQVRLEREADRELSRLDRIIERIESTLTSLRSWRDDIRQSFCLLGAEKYCVVVEEIKSVSFVSFNPLGNSLGIFNITRYYSPIPNQERYLYEFKDRTKGCTPGNMRWLGYRSRVKGEYRGDLCINSQGSAFKTADGTDLRLETPFRVAACPPEFPFGTKLNIEKIGVVTCRDRGGAIKGKRMDVWAGIGDQAILDMQNSPGGLLNVYAP